MSVEDQIKEILSNRGLELNYKETYPSSKDDIYEMNIWFEDRNLTKYPFHNIFIRPVKEENPNYKQKAFEILLNTIIEGYFDNLNINNEVS